MLLPLLHSAVTTHVCSIAHALHGARLPIQPSSTTLLGLAPELLVSLSTVLITGSNVLVGTDYVDNVVIDLSTNHLGLGSAVRGQLL